MVQFAINQITAPRLTYAELFALARDVGAVGVELRNDLDRPLFEGDGPEAVRTAAEDHEVRIVGLSQVYPFNRWSDETRGKVERLVEQALAVGAPTVSLIPCNDGTGQADGERQGNVMEALEGVAPLIAGTSLLALVEPLGFQSSSLRSKAEALALIDVCPAPGRFKLVHDTFHHYLDGGGPLFPERTGIVHVSGVIDFDLAVEDIRDEHRVLVDDADRLGNLMQLARLLDAGYDGPISIEAFSPEVQDLSDHRAPLKRTIRYLRDGLGV